jgi:endonuclease/exonuclease/phosphatase family metal-dependent hydrolase
MTLRNTHYLSQVPAAQRSGGRVRTSVASAWRLRTRAFGTAIGRAVGRNWLPLLVAVAGGCRERDFANDLQPAATSSQKSALKKPARPAAQELLRWQLDPASAWHSAASCEAALRARRAQRSTGTARIASWNVRWFPDSVPGKRPRSKRSTNLAWLACAIAWLDVDVLAVQEFKRHARAEARLAELLSRLDGLTGGVWRSRFDDCSTAATQHVGFLYDSKRVHVEDWQIHAALNPHGEACKNQLRPGLGGYFKFEGGLDAHLITVHFKSGTRRQAIGLRRKSIEGIAAAFQGAQRLQADEDVIVLGDFNTMGCARCSPKLSAEQELAQFSSALERLTTPFQRIDTAEPACSHYFRSKPALLDHVAVVHGMRELEPAAAVNVSGFCERTRCTPVPKRTLPPSAYHELSDHCPIVLELVDKDLD